MKATKQWTEFNSAMWGAIKDSTPVIILITLCQIIITILLITILTVPTLLDFALWWASLGHRELGLFNLWGWLLEKIWGL